MIRELRDNTIRLFKPKDKDNKEPLPPPESNLISKITQVSFLSRIMFTSPIFSISLLYRQTARSRLTINKPHGRPCFLLRHQNGSSGCHRSLWAEPRSFDWRGREASHWSDGVCDVNFVTRDAHLLWRGDLSGISVPTHLQTPLAVRQKSIPNQNTQLQQSSRCSRARFSLRDLSPQSAFAWIVVRVWSSAEGEKEGRPALFIYLKYPFRTDGRSAKNDASRLPAQHGRTGPARVRHAAAAPRPERRPGPAAGPERRPQTRHLRDLATDHEHHRPVARRSASEVSVVPPDQRPTPAAAR